MKYVAIIQARLGSTRLPLKMLLSLHGKPIIEWVVRRVQQSKLLNEVIVAIPDSVDNDTLAKFLESLDVKVYRGSEEDVLDRFYQAAVSCEAKNIIRVCADNPLIDPNEIDNLIQFYGKNDYDYVYNHIPKENSYPDGLGAEITTFHILEEIYNNATLLEHREHCMSYITDNPDKFSIRTFDPINSKLRCPELKFDIDTFEDYERLALQTFDINVSSEELVEIFRRKR